MNRHLLQGTAIGFVVACAVLLGSQLHTQEPDQNSASPSTIRYAEACLKLAETDLELHEDLNRRAPGTITPIRMEWLEANVNFATKQLEAAQRLAHGSTEPMQLAHAENAVKLAEQEYQQVKASQTYPPLYVKKKRIEAEVAALRVDMWKERSYLPSIFEQLQWQIDRLTEQTIELNQRLESIEQ